MPLRMFFLVVAFLPLVGCTGGIKGKQSGPDASARAQAAHNNPAWAKRNPLLLDRLHHIYLTEQQPTPPPAPR